MELRNQKVISNSLFFTKMTLFRKNIANVFQKQCELPYYKLMSRGTLQNLNNEMATNNQQKYYTITNITSVECLFSLLNNEQARIKVNDQRLEQGVSSNELKLQRINIYIYLY